MMVNHINPNFLRTMRGMRLSVVVGGDLLLLLLVPGYNQDMIIRNNLDTHLQRPIDMPTGMAPDSPEGIGASFVKLALAIDRHSPGYVDGYYGPPGWKRQVSHGNPRPLDELKQHAEGLERAILTSPDLEDGRRDHLRAATLSAQTTLRRLKGEAMTLAEEVAGVLDIPIAWKDESAFEALRQELSDLLPGKGDLAERFARRERALEVSPERIPTLARYALGELRHRARQQYDLPPEEHATLSLVKTSEPWMGYHTYQGRLRARIKVNTTLPARLSNFVHLLAHEGYPGHHCEHVLKETHLVREKGWMEFTIVPGNAPACVLSEGAAMLALETAFEREGLTDWFEQEIFPRAGLSGLNAARELAITRKATQLELLFGNAAILLHERGASDDEVFAYMRRYSPELDENLHAMLAFMKVPQNRTYTFCYSYGMRLVGELFQVTGDRSRWHKWVISEALTPERVRGQIANAPMK